MSCIGAQAVAGPKVAGGDCWRRCGDIDVMVVVVVVCVVCVVSWWGGAGIWQHAIRQGRVEHVEWLTMQC